MIFGLGKWEISLPMPSAFIKDDVGFEEEYFRGNGSNYIGGYNPTDERNFVFDYLLRNFLFLM